MLKRFGATSFFFSFFSGIRQKRKLDEMYDQLRTEYESAKRSTTAPANNFYSGVDRDLFSNSGNVMMDGRDTVRKGRVILFKIFRNHPDQT